MSTPGPWLVQYELDGEWYTCATRKCLDAAKAKARAEYRAMKGAHMTAIIRAGNPPILRRTFDHDFTLR